MGMREGAFEADRGLGVSRVQKWGNRVKKRQWEDSGTPLGMGSIQELDQQPRWDQENAWEGQASDGTAWAGDLARHRGPAQGWKGSGSRLWLGVEGLERHCRTLPPGSAVCVTSQVTVTPWTEPRQRQRGTSHSDELCARGDWAREGFTEHPLCQAGGRTWLLLCCPGLWLPVLTIKGRPSMFTPATRLTRCVAQNRTPPVFGQAAGRR